MVYQSSSIRSTDPAAIRLAVILNISPASEDAIDYTFKNLKAAYGNPFEFFLQEQWDGEKEYIAFIASGMKMPIDEIKAVHDRYIEMSNRVNKNGDEFYSSVSDLNPLAEDSQFNMIKEKKIARKNGGCSGGCSGCSGCGGTCIGSRMSSTNTHSCHAAK